MNFQRALNIVRTAIADPGAITPPMEGEHPESHMARSVIRSMGNNRILRDVQPQLTQQDQYAEVVLRHAESFLNEKPKLDDPLHAAIPFENFLHAIKTELATTGNFECLPDKKVQMKEFRESFSNYADVANYFMVLQQNF